MKILVRNLKCTGNPGGPFQVILSPSLELEILNLRNVGLRVALRGGQWAVSPLLGPLAPSIHDCNERVRTFKTQAEAMQSAYDQIRQFCAEMARLFSDVEQTPEWEGGGE